MNEVNLFILADKTLTDVIFQIKEDQWDMKMPDDFPTFDPEANYTLREIITYHAYDEAWVPAMLLGKTMEEVGKDAFGEPFDNELLDGDPKEKYSALSDKAIAAALSLSEHELDTRIVHFSYGDFPAREALRHITSFRGLRVYDLSKALGINTTMSEELVTGLWEMIEPRAEAWRTQGVFQRIFEVPEDAPLQDRLLGLTGRKP